VPDKKNSGERPMTKADAAQRIPKLLDRIQADFPRVKVAAEALMRQLGLNDSLALTVSPPGKTRSLPTFDPKRRRRPSPMLKARFTYAGTIDYGGDRWLDPAEMEHWMRKRRVSGYHKALRENYEGSAPCVFPDSDLTLLIVTEGVPDNLTYLVWIKSKDEPEIWSYRGMETYKFKNLASYFTWLLKRE
jgi:hypothetical protein